MSRPLIRILRQPRRWRTRWEQRLHHIDVSGLDLVRNAIDSGKGVLITPNHSSHADPFVFMDLVDRLERPFYFMVAWQLLAAQGVVAREVLRRHGCFSINRESADRVAVRQAVKILCDGGSPLVIFPEGDIYHHNDRVAPFHEGCGIIAQSAGRRARRPIVCIPCAVKYEYIVDPTAELERLAGRLELATSRIPRPDLPLVQRVRRLLAGLLRAKEREYIGRHLAGTARHRTSELLEAILGSLEGAYGVRSTSPIATARIQALRQQVVEQRGRERTDASRKADEECTLSDLNFLEQLFSYPPDYLQGTPRIERIAETLDKLEEDVLGVAVARARGARKATVVFGQPIPVDPAERPRQAALDLTQQLEAAVRRLLRPIGDTRVVRPAPEHVAAV